MGIVHRAISTYIVSKAGFSNKQAKTGPATLIQRIARYLEKVGLVDRDMENSFLNFPIDDEDSLLHLQGLHPD
jgi:hypothetical protein